MDPFQAPRRRGQGKLFIGIAIAVIAVGAIGYLLYGELQGERAAPGSDASSATRAPAAPSTISDTATTTPAPTRSDTILTCEAVDGSIFYTNATRCEDADLDNRVNVLPALEASPVAPGDCLGAQPGGPRVQSFLAVCMEPFNEALELEPLLLESPDPARSRAARRYCDLITQGVQAGCMATSDQFCFLPVCQALREQGPG